MEFSRSSLNWNLGRKELMNFTVISSATEDYKLVVCAGYWYDETKTEPTLMFLTKPVLGREFKPTLIKNLMSQVFFQRRHFIGTWTTISLLPNWQRNTMKIRFLLMRTKPIILSVSPTSGPFQDGYCV